MQIIFGLALRLQVDVEQVKMWPYAKINDWMAYFKWADDEESRK